jgi:peptidoglycan/xylan/chitin deacetylase (PgdA/CDA1 family)
VSQKLGSTNSWDKDSNAVESPLMKIDELLKWHDSGNEVGSHTQYHNKLTSLTMHKAGNEISDSKSDLEQIIGQSIDSFCYPYGEYFDEHIDIVNKSGYQSAVTTVRGKYSVGSDLLQIKRVPITCYTTVFHFALKMFTGYEDRKGKKRDL